MQSIILSSVNKKFYILLRLIFASIKALRAIGKNSKGYYSIWNKLIIANVLLGVKSFPIDTNIAKVALRINIGLNQIERMFKQEMKNLTLRVFIS